MKVHPDLASLMVDMDVRRRDVVATSWRIGEAEAAARVDSPRPGRIIGERKPDVRAVVMSEIEVETAEPPGKPVGCSDQRGAVDIGSVAFGQHRGTDDWFAQLRRGGRHRSATQERLGKPTRPL